MVIKGILLLLLPVSCMCSYVNLALNKTASMSTNNSTNKWLADAAIDGNTNQDINGNSCAVTSYNHKKQAWWRVDLGVVSEISSVIILNRLSYTFRLSGFAMFLSNTTNWWTGTRCFLHNNGEHKMPWPSDNYTVSCNGTGRYLTIYKQRNITCASSAGINFCAILELCEVQVLACDENTYGPNCEQQCSGNCLNGSTCNRQNGHCDNGCSPGYTGPFCNSICSSGSFGQNCASTCEKCKERACNHITGKCESGCQEGWDGPYCNETCAEGTFGLNCSSECGHCINGTCDPINGSCLACKPGWQGQHCNETCTAGKFGLRCNENCSENCYNARHCSYTDGTCYGGCQEGWMSKTCNETCKEGTYGYNCSLTCENCINEACFRLTGLCTAGCKPGWRGHDCNGVCSPGYFGTNCSSRCPSCSLTCHHETGKCLVFSTDVKSSSEDLLIPFIVMCAVTVIMVLAFAIVMLYLCRRDNKEKHTRMSNIINDKSKQNNRQSEEIHTTIGEIRRYNGKENTYLKY